MSVEEAPVMARKTGTDKAVAILGGKSATARRLGITPQAVDNWDGVVPLRWLFKLEEWTGVSREELRPDLFMRQRPKERVG